MATAQAGCRPAHFSLPRIWSAKAAASGMAMGFEERLRDRDRWSIGDRCSAARVLELLSTKTVFLVVRECFYGTTRFEDFVSRIGTSAPAVSRALKQLESAQVITRVPYQEPGSRVRGEYRLTEAGEDLLPVLLSLMQWGDKHLQQGCGPLSFVEAGTARAVKVRATADPVPEVTSDDIEIRLNPAMHRRD
ncbi:winged helix-turn-helix transcriptional regulator [Saccharopolyspora mangrovi]|uniref:Helix-turn-helix domain-containing protein n=1 Tax=Saccharopolyspora mangrovi TaxID=3082379 RepID=A0ABU6AER8_9PSEU|nr:helix-turn-helix domain-containing protein [Saccharopolyspora sp. S2-29]MEB3370043.1 helix-turn-helix domain-containing protein [Saccharopolyspora sp. S2-29]